MVKGVNKTVIEVNNTGSLLFEKIVFYVTPEYSNLSAKQLRKAAGDFSFGFQKMNRGASLRKRYRKKRRLTIALAVLSLVAVLSAVLLIIL